MEIKSSLLNSKDLKLLKDSLIAASEVDGKENFRVRLIEYIDDTADNEDDEFFYDMIEFCRFLKPDPETTAYTTPDHIIYLNAPGVFGEKIREWDFVYCHECLHQLWETFEVADQIQKNGIKYDHDVLNVASDCVINDYLSAIRKKTAPPQGITPEYLKKTFDVDYDRIVDTQYTLYLKLLEHIDELKKDQVCQKSFDGKIKPKSVTKQQGPTPPPPPPGGKFPKEYIDGWTDAIQDVLDKKVDPLDDKRKPKNTGVRDYDKGYEDCIKTIKKGLEDGITISDGGSNGNNKNNDGGLPQIPWDIDNQNQGGDPGSDSDKSDKQSDSDKSDKQNDSDKSDKQSDSGLDANTAQQSADEAKKAADKAQQNADSGKGSQKDADAAKEAAKEAQNAADRAKDAADKGDKEGEAKSSKEAKAAADKAKKLAGEGEDNTAESAQQAANEAKNIATNAQKRADSGEISQGVADAIKEAAKEAQDAADRAKRAAESGNKSAEAKAAKEAKDAAARALLLSLESDDTEEMTEEEKAQIKAKAESVIKKYKEKISGAFGDFIKKCKNSVKCDPNGLANNTRKGKGAWNKQMDLAINAYVKKNLDKKKRQFEQTYKRVKRGSGFVKMGAPIIPGKRIKDNKMPINIAYYIDRSGSMSGCIDQVFEAAFKISEALKQRFKKDKFVDSIDFRTFVFNDSMEEIKFGQKKYASGGTMDFDKILEFINKNTKNVLINIIITDAGFGVDEPQIKKFLKDGVDGLVIFVTNMANEQVKKIADKPDFKTKLIYILADANFDID